MKGFIGQKIILVLALAAPFSFSIAQQKNSPPSLSGKKALPVFNASAAASFSRSVSFIQQAGQYNTGTEFSHLGKTHAGYEGFTLPVLFADRGIIFLQKQITKLSHREEEKLEKEGRPEEEIEKMRTTVIKKFTIEWVGANSNPVIELLEKTTDYHTYDSLPAPVYGYKKILFKNVYDGIDILYTVSARSETGFEYSFIIHPGADIETIRMKYDGDIEKIKLKGEDLLVKTAIGRVTQSGLKSFVVDTDSEALSLQGNTSISTAFAINDTEVRFVLQGAYDHSKILVVDPFVSSTANLTGLNVGEAKDVDFDYAGNVYVTGGGDGVSSYRLAKFDAAGVLQWTFSGVLTLPAWSYGPYYGGSVVDKSTGNIYLGQGFIYPAGFRVIRISTSGLYDNYISTPNGNFTENWKMYWNCNSGTPQILIAGGGINSNVNFGTLAPPSTTINSLNVTGLAGAGQDIVDIIIDPSNNEMYTAYASLILSPGINNKLYKNTAPYSAASVAWNISSGYSTLSEAANRPYLATSLVDNSANIFAINAGYLFYWDGKNLKAFNKTTGAAVGTPLATGNAALFQGGIIADACNNIFVGDANGTIKVYNFNGSVFDDAVAPDITVAGYPGKSVFDLAYDESRKILYASGDGFAASFDVSPYCASNTYSVTVTANCAAGSATVTLNPAPPAGSVITYVLNSGALQLATNTTGTFSGLLPNNSYTVVATINQACSGVRAAGNFTLPGPVISLTPVNTACGSNTGQITASGSGSAAPYTYSKDGLSFQPGGLFTNLSAGVYTITVSDVNGCKNTAQVTLVNTDGPSTTYTFTNATCGSSVGTVTVSSSGGVPPYQYSINNGVTYQSGNFFTALAAGSYTLVVKDANNCMNAAPVSILSGTQPQLSAIASSATCGTNNGSITAFGSGGVLPLEYSINGNIYQAGSIFTNLTPGAYTVTVRDAAGCIKTAAVTVANNPAPTVTAVTTVAACANANGTITANGLNGVPPLQYSIDGVNFGTGNVFAGLTAGLYTVTVKDATGCVNAVTATVGSTGGPTVTASSTASGCSVNSGTISAAGSGTIGVYQYSINGINFQVGGSFNSLAPGNYVVLVRDGNGCIGATAVVVNATAGPDITATTTPASCLVNDGSITASGTGGTAPLSYSIDGVTFVPGNVFSGLASGVYTITVSDFNSCKKTTTITVANTSGLTLSVSTIAAGCNSTNGVITATASGGLAPLVYSIDGTTYLPGNVFNAVAPGNYTVYVKDGNNCIVTRQTTISTTSTVILSTSVVNATCGSASGIITASGSGGTAPLQYSINGTLYQSSGTFINVTPGTYTVYAKDASNCISTQSVTVTSSGAGTAITGVTYTIKGAYVCNGGTLGKITNLKGLPNGGGNTYTFSLDFGAFTTSNQFTNVTQGIHIITAQNQDGCTTHSIATLGLGVPSTASTVVTGTACNTTNGSIALTGIGPNTPYHVSISGIGGPWIDFDPNYTFSGLAPGTYTLIMADDESFDAGPPVDPGGCLDTLVVVVPAIGGPSVSVTQTTGSCGNANASITASGIGTPPLQYSLNGGAFQSGAVFSNLSAGVYTLTVEDGTGCSNSVNVTVIGSVGPAVTASTTPTACNLNNGIINVSGTGGTPPYEYSINGTVFQSGTTFSNLAAGSYNLYIKDAAGCYSTRSVSVTAGARVVASAFTLAASCNNNDGIVFAVGTAGTTPYQYSIDGVVYQSSPGFSGLAAGTYTVYVKDARDCISTSTVSVANTGAATITAATVTGASCGNPNGIITITATGGTPALQYSKDGISYSNSNVLSGLLPGPYTVYVKDANGCLTTRLTLVTNADGPRTLTATFTNAACGLNNGSITAAATGGSVPLQYSINGTAFQAGASFASVGAGSYTLYVRDARLCVRTIPVTIINLPAPTVTATASASSCLTNDGTITATALGGTGTLSYSRNGTTFQASNIFTGVAPGTYTITVRDTRLCTATVTNVVVAMAASPAVSETHTNASCAANNGSITATATGGSLPYQYSINGTVYQSGNSFTALAPTAYTLYVKDANGCIKTTPVTIANLPPPGITATATGGCAATGTIIAAGTGGAAPLSYSIDGTNFVSTDTFTNVANGTYTVTVKDAGGCFNTTMVTVSATPSNPRTWLGVNTDWQDGVNWCGGVPTINDDVLIPSGLVNYPDINNGIAYSKNITIQTGASVWVHTHIQIADTITNQGVLDATAGTVELNGAAVQNISGSMFYQHTIYNLIHSNTSTTGVLVSSTPGDTLKIIKKLSFGFANAVLTTGNQVTLLSSDTATAAIGMIQENADGSPKVIINGNFIVERYSGSKRSWRLITAPLKADAASPSINAAWQEGANPPSVTGVSNPDPHPGYGTHITGPYNAVTPYAPLVTASGFDQSPQNNSSLKFYDTTTHSFKPVTNTLTTKVTDKQGYLMFIRGDRSYNIGSTTNFMVPSLATLRVRGNINTGQVNIPADTGMQVIGNPYPSAIRFTENMFTDNAAILKNQSFWLWDPLRGAARNTPVNVGGWVPVVYAGGGSYISTYNPGVSVAGLDSAHAFDIDGSIQSGAAFVIDNQPSASGSFVIHESCKIDGSNNQQFRPLNPGTGQLLVTLFRTDDSRTPVYWADGTIVLMKDNFSNHAKADEEVRKLFGPGENICVVKEGLSIAVERRNNCIAGDTIQLSVNRLKAGRYKLEFYADQIYATGVQALLDDRYTGLQTPVSLSGNTLADIDVNADSASWASNRFRLLFIKTMPLPVKLISLKAWRKKENVALEWEVQEQLNVLQYVVERSADNKNFETVTVVPVKDGPGGMYTSTDEHPLAGVNYYRIRIDNTDGSFSYSSVKVVHMALPGLYVALHPNPIQQGLLQFTLHGFVKGRYGYTLYNNAGQLMVSGSIKHNGGIAERTKVIVKKLIPGLYKLAIDKDTKTITVTDVLVVQ